MSSVRSLWAAELAGPIHGRIQTLRGMCTDERPHVEIDAKLAELGDVVYALRCAIEFPPEDPDAMAARQESARCPLT